MCIWTANDVGLLPNPSCQLRAERQYPARKVRSACPDRKGKDVTPRQVGSSSRCSLTHDILTHREIMARRDPSDLGENEAGMIDYEESFEYCDSIQSTTYFHHLVS